MTDKTQLIIDNLMAHIEKLQGETQGLEEELMRLRMYVLMIDMQAARLSDIMQLDGRQWSDATPDELMTDFNSLVTISRAVDKLEGRR
jgi:hypothetical protein